MSEEISDIDKLRRAVVTACRELEQFPFMNISANDERLELTLRKDIDGDKMVVRLYCQS